LQWSLFDTTAAFEALVIVLYQRRVDFVNEMVAPPDEHAAEQLLLALDGKGAFRRFQDTLHRIDERWLQAWYQWNEKHIKATIDAWLKEILS
jgi:hypothetical protein